MKVAARVPDPLRQKFLPLDNGFELDYSKLVRTRNGYDLNVKYLMDCSGEFTNFVALYCANTLSIHKLREDGMEAHHIFSEELTIQDVEYFRSSDEGFGLVVALNSAKVTIHPHCVAVLRWTGCQLKQLRKLKIEEEITCLKVIVDEPNMSQLQPLLHPRMSSWPHIIAVGTRLAHCYLLHFQLADRHQDIGNTPVTVKLTDGLKPFHSGNQFLYSTVDPSTGHTFAKKLSTELVDVTCISFLEKSRTVLVGFSFGGIMTISLTTCPTIDPLVYPCSAPVKFIAPLEPDDDPRSHLWFFAAYGTTKVKPIQLCLYEVMFPDEEALPLHERSWNRPVFTIKLLIPFHNSTRWISMQNLVRDRAELRCSDDSTRDSFRNGPDKDRSLVFFSYIANDKHGSCLMGGLFDLNAYYYKRLVQSIAHDGTAAQQCAFLSTVHPIPMHHKEEDFSLIKDLAVDTTCITRFISNVSDAEQMFYPSALEISVVHVAGAKKCYQFTLPSLPNQLLSTICADLEMHMADATSASSWLSALGFCRKEAQPITTDQYNNLCFVLCTLVSHQRAVSIVQFIKLSESTELRHLIASWIWEEVDKATKKMHETIEPLFARFSAPLSPAGQKSLAHVHDVFVAGSQILRELINACEREQDETKEYITSLEVQRFATDNLRSYSALIHQLIKSRILPVAEDREIRLAMEKALEERRSKASGQQLYIDKLVARMQRKSPNEPFWLAEGPKWYPPALLNLLAPILLLNIPTKWKGQLLAYYLLDYSHCKRMNDDSPDSHLNLVDVVTKQMHGLLGISKDELWSLYKCWCADNGKRVSEDISGQGSPGKRLSAQSEVKQMLSIPRPLSVAEEEKLKSLLKYVPFGEFAWQCYLARNNRYDQFVELPIPPYENNEIIVEYRQLLPVMRMLRQNNAPSSSKQISWPSDLKEKIEKFERERCSSIQCTADTAIYNRGKTPKPLNKRQSHIDPSSRKRQLAAPLQEMNTNSSYVSTESDKTTSVAKRALLDLSEEESVSLPRDIPTNTLNTITDILRTPQARARAAAQAESQRKWINKTPETEFQKPAPRSILKSAKTITERAASPSRNRLQFDLPSSSHSSVEQTTTVSDSSKQLEKMAQPNFDESFEYEEYSSDSPVIEEGLEGVSEGFIPYISPEHRDDTAEAQLEKSLEVQDEDEVEEDEANVSVEQQDEEEEIEAVHVSKFVLTEKDLQQHEEGEEHAARNITVECCEERSFEQQDEEDEMEPAEDVEDIIQGYETDRVVVQRVDHGTRRHAELDQVSYKQFEKQDELETLGNNNTHYIYREEQNEGEILDVVPKAKKQPSNTYEVQDENFEYDSVNIVRYESVVTRTAETTSIVERSSTLSIPDGQTFQSATVEPLLQDVVEVAEEVQDEREEDTAFEATALASGDAAHLSRSPTSADVIDSPITEPHTKLVDYSLHESSFECTPNLKKSDRLEVASDETSPRPTLELDTVNDDEVSCVGSIHTSQPCTKLKSLSPKDSPLPEVVEQHGVEEIESIPTYTHSSGSRLSDVEVSHEAISPPSAHYDLPVLVDDSGSSPKSTYSSSGARSPHPSEPDSSSGITESKQRSSRKSMSRTSAPATPVRQSQRLREKAAESHNLEEEKRAHDMDSETRKKGITDIVEHRRSPARTRSSTKEAELVTPKTPPQSSREDKESDNLSVVQTPTRTLRSRTPSRSRQNDVPTVSTTRTPRRSRRLSETSTASEATITTGSARKSPSRATRSRKVSTSEDEPVTSTRKSPSRRTPTRSMSATKQAKETANVKTKSFGRAAKALQQKFDTINPLGEMDARSYFDNAMAKKSIEPGGSRRRTRSDSEIPDIKSKKSKTLNIEETIEEVEEETATGSSRPPSRRKPAVEQQPESTEAAAVGGKGSTSRSRRASSASVVELSPARTRRTSGSSVSSVGGTPSTPKSPSRRGRPRGIETIPE